MEVEFQRMEDRDYDGWVIEQAKEFRNYEKLTGKYRSNKITIAHLKGKYKSKKQVVTDDMIAVAKKVPWDNFLKLENLGGRKRCACPFHTEEKVQLKLCFVANSYPAYE